MNKFSVGELAEIVNHKYAGLRLIIVGKYKTDSYRLSYSINDYRDDFARALVIPENNLRKVVNDINKETEVCDGEPS